MLRALFRLRALAGGTDWESELPGHHEDPLHMKRKELIHFAHKYYYRIISKAPPGSGLEAHFRSHSGDIVVPDGFKALQTVTVSAAGDLMPYDCISNRSCTGLWDECGDFFFGSDLVTANLETPVLPDVKPSLVPEVMLNHMYFHAGREMFGIFSGHPAYRGYDVLSVANNHALDQGEAGLKKTLDFLDSQGIWSCGAATSPQGQDEIPIVEKNGIRIGFLAATFSLNAEKAPTGKEWMINHLPLNTPSPSIDMLIRQAKKARENGADILIAHLHAGLAYQPYPSPLTVANYRRICESTGIDIILGGHPHNPQPLEFFRYTDPFTLRPKQSFILYSLGDFIAYDIFKWSHLPLMLRLTLGKGTEGTFLTGLEIKAGYMQASVQDGKVESLRLRDFGKLRRDPSGLDAASLSEFRELEAFADRWLLPGNVGKYLV
jgi:hypothetical protein